MDQPLTITLKRIDQRLSKLVELKRLLLEEFEEEPAPPSPQPPPKALPAPKPVVSQTRATAVAQVLLEKGPLARRAIVEATGFPDGTVSYVLNDKTRFTLRRDGRWEAKKPDGGARAPQGKDRSANASQKGHGRR